jgi:hypothetical protein
MCGIVGLFFKRGAVNGGASFATRSRFAADSLLEGDGFEPSVPRSEPSRTSESPVGSVEVLVGRAVLYEPTPIKGRRGWPSQIRRW